MLLASSRVCLLECQEPPGAVMVGYGKGNILRSHQCRVVAMP